MKDLIFKNEHGKEVNPNELIFALTSRETSKSPFRVIGTAFMIAKPGIFLTARHCLYKDSQCTDPWEDLIGIVHHALHVKWSTYVDGTDVAIGQLDMDELICDDCTDNKVMSLCTWTPVKMERICHWGCQQSEVEVNHLGGDDYHLKVQAKVMGVNGHYIEKLEDHPRFINTCHVTSAIIPFGASGGPVTLSSGQVFGINSSGSDGLGYSTASLIEDALNMMVPPSFHLNNETKGRKQTFEQLLSEFGVNVLKGD